MVWSRLVLHADWVRVSDKGQIQESFAELLLDPAMRRSVKGSGLRLASRSAKWVAVIVHGGISCEGKATAARHRSDCPARGCALREFFAGFFVFAIAGFTGRSPMDIASVFEWFAQESLFAAEVATDPAQRAMWVRLALLWAAAARPDGDEAASPEYGD
jgi:hypothetical protein